MTTKTQNCHIFQRLTSPIAVACTCLFAFLSQPLIVQAQTTYPTPQINSITKGQSITSIPLAFVRPKSMQIATNARTAANSIDEVDDPENLVPDDAPEDPLFGENDPVVTDGEELDLNNAGAIDGIYQCDYEFGEKTLHTYVSVNGMSDGRSIFLIANLAENNMAMWGWGFGQVTDVDGLGYAFVGETDNQLPFELAVVVDEQGQALAEGSVGFDVKGTKILAEISCRSIW